MKANEQCILIVDDVPKNIQLLGSNKESQGSVSGNVSNTGNATNSGMTAAPVVRTEPASEPAPVDDLPF